MTTNTALAQPLRIGAVTLRNRFVAAPMERNYCNTDGTVSERYVEYLSRLAQGGTALVFSEASYVRADGKGRVRQMGVDVDEQIPGMRRMVDAIHSHGALAGVELNHGGRTAQGRVSGFTPVAPTSIPCIPVGGDMPEELDDDDIEHLIECFGDAARRCQDAGVDVLSIHGGHGYLIHQFLSPAYNHRDDKWSEPTLFINRVIAAIRVAAPNVALGLRFSAFEGVIGGLDVDATRARIDAIDIHELDVLDVSAGNYEAGQWTIQPGEWRRGVLAPYARQYTHDFDIPVGVAGRISSPEAAEAVLSSGAADFVSMARTLHADPEFPNRVMAGERYRPCIACNYCIDSLAAGPIPCSVNPWAGRELEQPRHTTTAALARSVRIAVVGGGPAGMAAARELALAGHSVDLYDERGRLGGDFFLAATLHEYPEYGQIVEWYQDELTGLKEVTIHLAERVDASSLLTGSFDGIVLATGGRGPKVMIPGSETRRVRDVRDFLLAADPAPAAITIFGADREAAAVADDLVQRGTRVVMIGPQPEIAHDVGRRAKILLLPRLETSDTFTAYLSSIVTAVEQDRVEIQTDGRTRWIEAPGELVVSHGIEPRVELSAAARALAPRFGVHAVGDASGDGGSIHAALTTAVDIAARITADVMSSSHDSVDA